VPADEDHAMTMTRRHRLRPAITLVELMVAMALSIGIMWILAESFKMGLDFTRHARSTGSMMNQLDGARAVVARDLLAEHFLRDENKPNGGVRLSDQRLDRLSNTSPSTGWKPPKGGFFRIISPAPTGLDLRTDLDLYSMNTARNHALHFTSILPVTDQNLYTAMVGGFRYTSRSAEIGYFLVDSGLRTSPGPSGETLYHLVRAQRLAATTSDEISGLSGAVADSGVIASNGTNQIYTLADLRDPSLRLNVSPSTMPGMGTPPPTFGIASARYGEDLLLSNVLSFEVMVDWGQNVGSPQVAGSTLATRTTLAGNWDSPFDHLSVNAGQNTTYTNAGLFDTWYPHPSWDNFALAVKPNALPLAIRVKQIQITVRVFDTKTKQARQSTWKFSM
jgi:hypothetical protein